MLTVDLRIPSDAAPWPYDAEEYPILCMVDAGPLFTSKPVGEPAVILHRFGGTYGPATFLLVAGEKEGEGTIRVTLANQWGTPLRVLDLEDVRVSKKPPREPKEMTSGPSSAVERRPPTPGRHRPGVTLTVIKGTRLNSLSIPRLS